MIDETKRFIEKNIGLILDDDWNELYAKADKYFFYSPLIGDLTKSLLEAGIDPLKKGLENIPARYLAEQEFRNNPKLSIPGQVTRIGDSAFEHCPELESVSIPASVKFIGSYAFSNNKELKTVAFSEGLTILSDHVFYNCSNLSHFVLPETLESIGSACFKNCGALGRKEFILPKSLKSLGDEAFDGCLFIKIVIPGSIKILPEGCFEFNDQLQEVIIEDGVEVIGEYCFFSCYGLSELVIPASVRKIINYAFDRSGLKKITFLGTKKQWQAATASVAVWGDISIKTIHCSDGDIAFEAASE